MDDRLLALLSEADHGVLTTQRRNGRPQLSNVGYAFDPATRLIRISVTADRAKTKNLLRDPRASLHVTTADFRRYAVAEADADLTPVATTPDDETVEELVDLYRAVAGEHPDWDEFRTAMVTDRRLVVRMPVSHVYGMA